MKRFFLWTYAVGLVVLLVVTPFDLAISQTLFSGLNGLPRVISELVYVPPFFIGFFGIGYYARRFSHPSVPWWVRVMVYTLGIIGVVGLSHMFFRSMRFLPYYRIVTSFMIAGLVVAAALASRQAMRHRWWAFDYLAAVGLGLIVTLFYVVTTLKRVFGRARYYVVAENEALFSEWYHIRGMVFHRDFYSIPSGHITFVSIALWFVVVAMTIPRFRPYIKPVIVTVFVWIVWQGYLRICLGEHYVTDVVFSVLFTAALMHLSLGIARGVLGWLQTRFGM